MTASDYDSSSPVFLCLPCIDPKFTYFKFNGEKPKANGEGHSVDLVVSSAKSFRAIGLESAKVLVAAARIAATSMSKATAAARIDAEKRCKEAAMARKKSKEALEQVAFLMAKEKDVK